MIDEEETFRKFGYYSHELKPQSKKKIIAICEICGEKRILRRVDYRPYCIDCIRKRKGVSNPKWKRIKRTCEVCGKEFFVKASWVKRGEGRFCSRECFAKWKKDNSYGENNPSWKGGKIKRICKVCGKVFYVSQYVVKDGMGIFCSRECMGKWQSVHNKGEASPLYGRPISEDTKEKIRKALTGRKLTEAHKKKISKALKGEKAPNYGKHLSEETKQKLRKARQSHKRLVLPTKPEVIFREIASSNSIIPQYTGDSSFWIGEKGSKKLNPDFIIEVNGKRYAIEIFGDYWHSPLLNHNLREDATLTYRKKFYKKHGWHPIFIWESDLKREDAEAFVLNLLRKEGVIK